MALHLVNQAEEHHLDLILGVNYTLKLYKNDVTSGKTETQLDALTEASFTEATFTGYTSKALTGGSWTTTAGDPTTGTYAQQTFTSSANQAAQIIYGYYVTRTSDGKLQWFEDFSGPITISLNGDVIRITPTFTYEDNEEATVVAQGVKASQIMTAQSANYTTDATTDFSLANFVADSTRNYKICLFSNWHVFNGAGEWHHYVTIDGTDYGRIGNSNADGGTINDGTITGHLLWQPSSGTYNLVVTVNEFAGASTLYYWASANDPRGFWIEDVGPR